MTSFLRKLFILSLSLFFIIHFMTAIVFAETHRWGAASIVYEDGSVTLYNELTPKDLLDFNVMMTSNDVEIRAVVMQGSGNTPDVLYIIPEDGYIAVPEMITVEEGEQGTIMIYQEGLS